MEDRNLLIKDLGDGLFLFGDRLICSEKAISCEIVSDKDNTTVIREEYSRYYVEHTFVYENTELPKILSHSWERIYKESES